jgi:hypothetical protein
MQLQRRQATAAHAAASLAGILLIPEKNVLKIVNTAVGGL